MIWKVCAILSWLILFGGYAASQLDIVAPSSGDRSWSIGSLSVQLGWLLFAIVAAALVLNKSEDANGR